jgi:hypothetical protein
MLELWCSTASVANAMVATADCADFGPAAFQMFYLSTQAMDEALMMRVPSVTNLHIRAAV